VRNVDDVPEIPAPAGLVAARVTVWVALVTGTLAFGAVQPWAWGGMYTLAALALLCWAFTCLRQGIVRIAWTPLYVPLACFIGFAVLQWLSGHTADPIAGREAIISTIGTALVFFLAVNLFASESQRGWRRIGWIVSLFSFGLALFAIIQFFSDPERVYWTVKPRFGGYIFGPYVSHNHYAGAMEMLVGICLGFCLSLRGGAQRALAGFAVLVMISSVVLSGSRGGTTALAIEGILFVIVMATNQWRRSALAFFAITVVLASFWLLPANVADRLSTVAKSDVSYTTRKALTLDSLRMFRQHPWAGIGLGAFEAEYPRYQSFPSDLLLDYAHNDYAQLLAETGIAGVVLVLVSLVLFFSALRTVLRSGLSTQSSWIRLGAFLGCIGLLAHSWVDFNFHIPANAAWFAFLAGLTQAYAPTAQPMKARRVTGITVAARSPGSPEWEQHENSVASRMLWGGNDHVTRN
jgi:O-antigen ligase